MPFFAGIGAIVSAVIFKLSKELFRWGLFLTFAGMVTSFVFVFWGLMTDIYNVLRGDIVGLGTSYTGLLGCVISSLGIDQFMTSALAIFVTASIFWGTAVSYIVTFKFSKRLYSMMFRNL